MSALLLCSYLRSFEIFATLFTFALMQFEPIFGMILLLCFYCCCILVFLFKLFNLAVLKSGHDWARDLTTRARASRPTSVPFSLHFTLTIGSLQTPARELKTLKDKVKCEEWRIMRACERIGYRILWPKNDAQGFIRKWGLLGKWFGWMISFGWTFSFYQSC